MSFRLNDGTHNGVLVGVSICRNMPPHRNTHTGLVYNRDGRLSHLHLVWDERLVDEPLPSGHAYVIPNLPAARLAFFEVLFRKIAEAGLRPHYALKYPRNAQFVSEEMGIRLDLGDALGLNCSTFALAAFASYGAKFIDLTTWPNDRLADIEWQGQLMNWLQGTAPSHATLVEPEIGCQRVRPEEAAGACLHGSYPARFADAERASQRILAMLDGDADHASL
jgi:hypothetical protein